MKFFHLSNKEYDGIFHYLYQASNNEYPKVNMTGYKRPNVNNPVDDPIALVSLAPNANIIYENEPPAEAYIEFDLGEEYRAMVTTYQICSKQGTSASVSWNITAANSLDEWVTLDDVPEELDMCEIRYNTSLCDSRATRNFQIKAATGPFRYLRFNNFNTWYAIFFNKTERITDIRMCGFEIYGALYRTYESRFQTTCIQNQQRGYLMFVAIFIHYSSH